MAADDVVAELGATHSGRKWDGCGRLSSHRSGGAVVCHANCKQMFDSLIKTIHNNTVDRNIYRPGGFKICVTLLAYSRAFLPHSKNYCNGSTFVVVAAVISWRYRIYCFYRCCCFLCLCWRLIVLLCFFLNEARSFATTAGIFAIVLYLWRARYDRRCGSTVLFRPYILRTVFTDVLYYPVFVGTMFYWLFA